MSNKTELCLKDCDSVPWYKNAEDHKSPIGSILESISVNSGIAAADEAPVLTIQFRLMGNMRDGRVQLTYRAVHSYSLEGFGAYPDTTGNIWIQDTVELRRTNLLRHKVVLTGGNWSIDAEHVDYKWEAL